VNPRLGLQQKGTYVKDQKRQVSKTLALQALQSYKITPTNFARDQ
jgi:hypothetical protein